MSSEFDIYRSALAKHQLEYDAEGYRRSLYTNTKPDHPANPAHRGPVRLRARRRRLGAQRHRDEGALAATAGYAVIRGPQATAEADTRQVTVSKPSSTGRARRAVALWPPLPPLPAGACRCRLPACRSGWPEDLIKEQAARTRALRAEARETHGRGRVR